MRLAEILKKGEILHLEGESTLTIKPFFDEDEVEISIDDKSVLVSLSQFKEMFSLLSLLIGDKEVVKGSYNEMLFNSYEAFQRKEDPEATVDEKSEEKSEKTNVKTDDNDFSKIVRCKRISEFISDGPESSKCKMEMETGKTFSLHFNGLVPNIEPGKFYNVNVGVKNHKAIFVEIEEES